MMWYIVTWLILGGGGGYLGHRRWGFPGGASVGTAVLAVLAGLQEYLARHPGRH